MFWFCASIEIMSDMSQLRLGIFFFFEMKDRNFIR